MLFVGWLKPTFGTCHKNKQWPVSWCLKWLTVWLRFFGTAEFWADGEQMKMLTYTVRYFERPFLAVKKSVNEGVGES